MFCGRNNLKSKIKKYLKLVIIPSVLLFFGGITLATDLLSETISISQKEMIYPGSSEKAVGDDVFRGETQVGSEITSIPNLFSKVTRLLLMLVITLSVTMILYNGIKYIVETGQGKDSKSLMKNVAYIVIGILVSLFSIIIITLLRSVPTTIDKDVTKTTNNQTDIGQIGDKEGFTLKGLIKTLF